MVCLDFKNFLNYFGVALVLMVTQELENILKTPLKPKYENNTVALASNKADVREGLQDVADLNELDSDTFMNLALVEYNTFLKSLGIAVKFNDNSSKLDDLTRTQKDVVHAAGRLVKKVAKHSQEYLNQYYINPDNAPDGYASRLQDNIVDAIKIVYDSLLPLPLESLMSTENRERYPNGVESTVANFDGSKAMIHKMAYSNLTAFDKLSVNLRDGKLDGTAFNGEFFRFYVNELAPIMKESWNSMPSQLKEVSNGYTKGEIRAYEAAFNDVMQKAHETILGYIQNEGLALDNLTGYAANRFSNKEMGLFVPKPKEEKKSKK